MTTAHGSSPTYTDVIGRDIGRALDDESCHVYSINFLPLLPDRDQLIYEFGCGGGEFLECMARHGYTRLAGVDSDQDAIEGCRKRLAVYSLQECTLTTGDALAVLKDMPDGSLPCVIMINTVEHMKKDALLAVVREIHRVLKPGGSFIATTGNIENPFNIGIYLRDYTHEIGFTSRSMRNMLILSGFSRENTRVLPYKRGTRLLRQKIGLMISFFSEKFVKLFARSMSMHIDETSKFIIAIAVK